jgi:hypothetical protein
MPDPLNPKTHCMLATAMQGGELNASEAEVRPCLSIAPSYSSGHALVAYILMLQGRANEAIDECKLEAESGSPICLALVYHADGREKDSEPALAQAIRGLPATSPCSTADVFA